MICMRKAWQRQHQRGKTNSIHPNHYQHTNGAAGADGAWLSLATTLMMLIRGWCVKMTALFESRDLMRFSSRLQRSKLKRRGDSHETDVISEVQTRTAPA